MKLRAATCDDLADICALGRVMHSESTFAPMDFNVDRVKETITDLMNKNQFVVVAESTNGELVGGMAGMVVRSWFGDDMVASDLALFVRPDARGGMAAVKLITAFVHWAKLAGAKQIRPGVSTGSRRAEDLFGRLGFTRCGSCFFMEGV